MWQPVGPTAVSSQNYGLVTGRVAALALDPSDPTGNRLYVGATGGGVWFSQNAGAAASSGVVFTPLTDTLSALSDVTDASISIGALTVQPGGTGVVLAGTGDPNDALDSYYGAGILRSTDGGQSWTLIQESANSPVGAEPKFGFIGEGFAGFAWSTVNPELVVAAVSQAYEGTLVNAGVAQSSYEGLYYSTDSGATWNLATITDGSGNDVQGPNDPFVSPDGNAATSVVWNPVRGIFVAAVRFHGYYQSANGVTWTRLADQPGTNLSAALCPTNSGSVGSIACPIFRGTLAVNPQTGDTFAWTVDANNQDQGIWQDKCAISNGACSSQNITFSQQWNTSVLETNTIDGPATIENGDYNLALAAVPSQQDTLLLAGDNDVWKCSLALGCVWRNTTNANSCMSAKVAGYQHALEWNPNNPLEIFVGNDSGLWRSTDAIGETGSVCAATDASHFQNLNGGLGSLAEAASLSTSPDDPFTLMAGLGVNGTAGVKSTSVVSDWPQVLGGEGGPVAIDAAKSSRWYVNNGAGVSIHLCSQTPACTPSAFATSPVVNNADTGNDGLTMTAPAPFLVDPLDDTQLLIGTCRVWRGPADGVGWSASDAISPFLDGDTINDSCSGDALIRSIGALATTGGGEAIYVGMYGSLDGGETLAGHVFGATIAPHGTGQPLWQDLTLNPVTNDSEPMNALGLDISSIFVDPHDASGNTVYVTVEGFSTILLEDVRALYRSTDGGAHWQTLNSNLIPAPANSVVVDPLDANTVYIATDLGVFSTRQVAGCATAGADCWTAFGTGLPDAPVIWLAAAPATASAHVLTAATYGRGIWQNPLWTSGTQLTTATVKPTSLAFGNQQYDTTSAAQTVTLTNTGSVALTASITMSGDFSETDNCQTAPVASGASCQIQVTFTPSQTGARSGQMTIAANVAGGQLTVALTGTGTPSGSLSLSPLTLSFGQVPVNATSSPLAVSANNTGQTAVAVSGVNITGPFEIASNTCGSSVAAQSECQILIEFAPKQPGAAAGTFTMTDGAGTQAVQLSGAGAGQPTDTLSTASLTFSATVMGQKSAPKNVVMTNSGALPLTSIHDSASGNFQVTQNCGTLLPGSSSCAFSVVFAPKQVGAQTGTLKISDALREQTVKLSGTGVEAPRFSIAPAQLTFAPQTVGVASPAMALTVSNKGGAPMANVSFQIIGLSAGSFAVLSTTCGATLKNGSSCTARVEFKPVATGGNSATLVISSSTIDVTAAQVPLSGTGLAPPEALVEPPVLEFNSIVIGSSSTAQAVTVRNVGGAAFTKMNLAIRGDYKFSAGTCTARLAVGASCAAKVTFSPTSAGSRVGVFTVSGGGTPATVSLQGTGIGPAILQASASQLNFGNVAQGQVSSAKTLTIFDLGTTPLKGLSFAVTGAFRLQQNQCRGTLAANLSCSVQIVFAPVAPGSQTGVFTVASTTQWAAPVTVSLTGIGMGEPALEVSPQQLGFGSVPVGGTGTGLAVSLSNPGGAAVTGLSLKMTGDFSLTNDTCGATLSAGASCGAVVQFSPTATGARSGALAISDVSTSLMPLTVPLSGVGQAAGSLGVQPSNLLFGEITSGQTSPPQTATITNTSQSLSGGLQFKTSTGFRVLNGTCGASLAAGVNCTLQIAFSPSGLGNVAGTLTASSSTAGIGSGEIVLTGTSVPPGYLVASPSHLTLPSTPVGSSNSAVVTLIDPGVASIGGIQVKSTGDFSAAPCATVLPAGGSCKMKIVFAPTGEGVRAGQLTVTTTAAGAVPEVISLVGTGTAPPALSLNPTTLNFPGTAAGQTSAAETIVVGNPGSVALETPSLKISGDFHVISNACIGALAAGRSCDVMVDFAPVDTGGRTGTLTVSSATRGVQPASVSLTGIGLTTAAISVSPLELTFPVVLKGQTSKAQTVTIVNAGGSSIPSLTLAVTPQFAITQNRCKGPLAPASKCTAGILFQPAATGPITGGLTISSPSVPVPANVALSGTGGVPAAIELRPAVVNFPTTGVGHASSPITITVTDPGTVAAVNGLALKTGAGFRLVNNRCSSVLKANSSCTTGIEFVPSKAGTQQSTLTVAAAHVKGGSVTLMGTGFDFTLNLKGTSSESVGSGQSASYTLSIATLGGSQGAFTFQCGSLPQNAQCTFNPPSETVTASATGFVTLQITTGSAVAAAGTRSAAVWRVAPVAFGLLLLPLAWRRRHRLFLMAALFALAIGGMSSCVAAGGSGNQQLPPGPGATPAGSYTIRILATSTGVQHSVSVSLTVD